MSPDPLLYALLSHTGFTASLPHEQLLPTLLRAFSRIPYENISKIIRSRENSHGAPKESPEELIAGFISDGTGGTCFPLTMTLVRLVRSLGYEAHPILADRRYGADTHCAVIFRDRSSPWLLLDPGYLIGTPCVLPSSGELTHSLPLAPIVLAATPTPDTVSLYTLSPSSAGQLQRKYRLTYKVTPVDESEFNRAWDRSFQWEMMQYPIISSLVGDTQVYVQKDSLLIRSQASTIRETLAPERMIAEVSTRLGISADVVKRCLECL